jgi:hypothetical protein
LAIEALASMASDARQVVVCLLDALSFSRFTGWLDGPGRPLQPLVAEGLLAPLTSVVPPQTASALTTLWTGRSPAEHGILGYELLLREYGLITNMITLAPAAFDNQRGLLERAGVHPQTLLPLPTLGTRLTQAGIDAHAFIGNSIRGSGLSRMHYADAMLHGFGSPADLWHSMRQLVESPPPGRRFAWAYYSGVDALSHVYGPDSDLVRSEYEFFVRAMVYLFVQPLDRRVGRDVLLLLIADHGQVATTIQPHYLLAPPRARSPRHFSPPERLACLPVPEARAGRGVVVRQRARLAGPSAIPRSDHVARQPVRPRTACIQAHHVLATLS